MKISRTSIGLASLSLLAIAGCPVTGGALCDNGTCEAAIDATTTPPEDAGPDGIVVAPRDECVDKPTAPECLTDEKAFFVSRSADPAVADGTIAKPYASITTALGKVTDQKKRIYICEGTYEEQVSIGTVPATLIGGIACDFRTPGAKAKIKPASGIALGIAQVGGASVIDIAVEAVSDVNTPGSSAVGVFITSSQDILLRGVEINAGAGQPGVDGTHGKDASNYSSPQAPSGVTGSGDGTVTTANACPVCADGSFSKAGNGAGRVPMQTNATSGDASPKASGQVLNGGGSGDTCSDGNPGAHGAAGAKATGGTVPGTLAAKSWTDRTTTAVAGKSGGPGQGGGGGGVLSAMGGGGGTGACGGCGGTGGGAGTDGGSSIGILVYQSTKVILEKSTVTTADGGKGGNGGDGQPGQGAPTLGAPGGVSACNGGAGGQGAGGGGGGGGVGGYSAAIAYVGEAPQTPQSVLTPKGAGLPGTGGKGGAATGAGNKGEDGSDGAPSKADAVLLLPQ